MYDTKTLIIEWGKPGCVLYLVKPDRSVALQATFLLLLCLNYYLLHSNGKQFNEKLLVT